MGTFKTMKEQFDHYNGKRGEVLDRAFEQAQLTIPRLFPRRYDNFNSSEWYLPELYSSKPASNVMRLSNMMTNALFPPNDVPFFELRLGPETTEEEKDLLRDPILKVEQIVLKTIQESNYRQSLFAAIQQASVLSDSLIYQNDIDSFKVYHIKDFLIRRDGEAKVQEIWTVDWVVTDLLPDELKGINGGKPKNEQHDHEPLYTRVYRDGKQWKVDREFREVKYESGKTYRTLPYYHIGWTPVVGEDYSRSIVEENLGTIRSLEMCSKALAEGIAAGSEGRIVIEPSSGTRAEDIGDSNWQIITARRDSLSTFQPDVSSTVGIALESVRYYESILDEAFLAGSVSDLRGERVTARQTNEFVNERAQAIGGVLATIEQNLELMVKRTIDLLVNEKKILPEYREALEKGGITLHIASGLDALSRLADAARIEAILNLLASTQDPEIHEVFNKTNLGQGYARSTGLDMDQYTRTDEQIAERAQARQEAQLQQQASQQAIQSAGAIAEDQLGR